MAKIDPADLLNSAEVSTVLGLSRPTSVAVYRARYEDFPAPVVDKGACLLWARADVVRWAKARGSRSA